MPEHIRHMRIPICLLILFSVFLSLSPTSHTFLSLPNTYVTLDSSLKGWGMLGGLW